jgi:hypothetical protein
MPEFHIQCTHRNVIVHSTFSTGLVRLLQTKTRPCNLDHSRYHNGRGQSGRGIYAWYDPELNFEAVRTPTTPVEDSSCVRCTKHSEGGT